MLVSAKHWRKPAIGTHTSGGGNGSPLQGSCLENPRDGRAWWAAIYGVVQSWTRLKWLSSSSTHISHFCVERPSYLPPIPPSRLTGLGTSRKPEAVAGVLCAPALPRVLELLPEECHVFRVNWTEVVKSWSIIFETRCQRWWHALIQWLDSVLHFKGGFDSWSGK